MPSPSSIRLTVDLDALAHNYAAVAHEARGAEVAPAVKADAYGLGAGPVARRLWAEGARSFFAARLDEGVALREALGPDRAATIYVLDGFLPGWGPTLKGSDLTPVINSLSQLEALSGFARGHGSMSAALHVDTGMNRLGMRTEEVEALLSSADRLQAVHFGLVMSHLACGSEPGHAMNARQADAFRAVARRFPDARKSLAASGGAFLGEDFLFDMVRPGVSLYGGGPHEGPDARLHAVATLEAPILQVRAVPAGETIGYGGDFRATGNLRVAILAAGYADGLLRALHPKGHVWFAGAPRRVLGRLSMDLMAVDVTGCEDALPGAMVEILGPNALIDDAAKAAGTSAYEFLVRIGARTAPIYLGEARA